MRRNNKEAKEIFESAINQLNYEFSNRINFRYHWHNKTPPYVMVKIKYKLGNLQALKLKIGFIFSGDLNEWKELAKENPKLVKIANFWIQINDGWSDDVIIRNIIYVVNKFYDKVLDWEFETGIGINDIIDFSK